MAEEEEEAFAEESIEALEATLAGYQASLQSVEAAAALHPDPELTKLVEDLQELVQVYQARVNVAKAAAASSAGAAAADAEEEHQGQELEAPVDVLGKPEALLRRTCYAPYHGEWYTATVKEVHKPQGGDDKNGLCATVLYIGWGNEEKLSVDELRFIASHANVSANTSCYAISSKDGLWYRGVILRKADDADVYVVRFKETAEVEQLPFDRVTMKLPAVCVSPTALPERRGGRSAEIITPGGYRIPEKLVIKPEDSEKMRQVKKRKVEVIKREQRKKLKEKEATARADSWKQHAAKVARATGSTQLLRKQTAPALTTNPSSNPSFAAEVRFVARPHEE